MLSHKTSLVYCTVLIFLVFLFSFGNDSIYHSAFFYFRQGPYRKTHSHNDLSLVNLLFIKRSDVLRKNLILLLWHEGHSYNEEKCLPPLQWNTYCIWDLMTCFVRAYFRGQMMFANAQTTTGRNRWDETSEPSRRQVQKTSISVRGWKRELAAAKRNK